MNPVNLIRQSDLIPTEVLAKKITIVGCGATGSAAALALTKMGMSNVHIYDDDVVDEVNLSAQFHPFSAVGFPKTESLRTLLKIMADVDVTASNSKYLRQHAIGEEGIVIVAADSMSARREIFETLRDEAPRCELMIDPRMGPEYYEQHALRPSDTDAARAYEKTLFSDDDAAPVRCTAKSTVYTALLAGGLIAKSVKNYLVGQHTPTVVRWDIVGSNKPFFYMKGEHIGGQIESHASSTEEPAQQTMEAF